MNTTHTNTMKSTTLTADQLALILNAVQNDLRARLARRHIWRKPVGSFPAKPAETARAYAEIREIIAALRTLNRQYRATWNREWHRRAA